MAKGLNDRIAGEKVWDFDTGKLLRSLRAQLNLLDVPGADLVTWKAMRSGKATHLAGGANLHDILVAGDWRSAAVFRYVREEHADIQECLAMAFKEDQEDLG